jgi:hypothetical protein
MASVGPALAEQIEGGGGVERDQDFGTDDVDLLEKVAKHCSRNAVNNRHAKSPGGGSGALDALL